MDIKQHRSAAVGVGVVVLALGTLTVTGSRADDRGVCVERSTSTRLPDEQCDESSSSGYAHGWYYIPSGRQAPAVGQPIAGQGSFVAPSNGSFCRGGVSATGGTVTRGGFLSSHSTFGG